jgi:hypothetical protein
MIVLLFLTGNSAGAQDLNPDNYKSITVSRAIRACNDWEEKATRDFQDEQQSEIKDLVEELEKALKKETADGHLDEALKLRKAIAALQNQHGTNPDTIGQKLIGRWKMKYGPNGVRYNDITQQGNRLLVKRWIIPDKRLEDEGEIVVKNGEIWMTWDDGKRVERFHFTDNGLIVEHWFLAKTKTTDVFPQQFGIGEKLK